MIDELSYDEVLKISNELKKQIGIVSNISTSNQEIKDFISTVEGYSKYLENIVSINKDADKALTHFYKIEK